MAEEATKDMAARGLQVEIVKPAKNWTDRIKRLMWTTIRAKNGHETMVTPQGHCGEKHVFYFVKSAAFYTDFSWKVYILTS